MFSNGVNKVALSMGVFHTLPLIYWDCHDITTISRVDRGWTQGGRTSSCVVETAWRGAGNRSGWTEWLETPTGDPIISLHLMYVECLLETRSTTLSPV